MIHDCVDLIFDIITLFFTIIIIIIIINMNLQDNVF